MRLMSHVYRTGDSIPLHSEILWRVETGLVQMVTVDNGQPITLAIMGVGEVFGAALTEVSPCHVICLTDVKLEIIPACLCRYLLIAESLL